MKKTFYDVVELVAMLTGKNGCPWDKEQTHKSIRKNMLEEAAEAAEAIDSEDIGSLIEELGDVLLQPVFHADIARRAGNFSIDDITTALYNKIYSRHTHVFGGDKALTAEDALAFWQAAKKKEKEEK